MSENKENTWFYMCDENFIKTYTSKKKLPETHKKIITRLNPDYPDDIELFKILFPNCKMLKRERDGDVERVKQYEWDLMHYDNTGMGDSYNYISFIVTSNEDSLFQIVKSNFNNIWFRKNNPQSYTLKINPENKERGIWRNEQIENIDCGGQPEYPVAIVSFGRYNDYGRTHKLLTTLKIKHYLFVEPCEYKNYKMWYDKRYCELLKGEEDYHLQDMGSTPMRNYILKYFKNNDEERVWLLDDNIKCYKRLYRGAKNVINSFDIFTTIEKYVMRYDNVGIASHNFAPFITEGGIRNILCKNGKCYSSMLIPLNTDIWFNHKHQEDNFISIEYVSKGYTNLCFNHIMYEKNTSGEDGGGNTKFIYKKDEKDIGRQERYNYSFETAKRLIEVGDIKLKEDMDLSNFCFHKPLKHEYYHLEFNYQALENFDKNDIVRNNNDTYYLTKLYLDTD